MWFRKYPAIRERIQTDAERPGAVKKRARYFKKGYGHFLKGTVEIYQFIKEHRSMYGVKEMCRVLGVQRSNYYRWLRKPEGVRKKQDTILKSKIEQEFIDNRSLYGAGRISEALRKKRIPCGKTRTKRLMNELGIQPKRRTKYKITTQSNHSRPHSQNLLNQDFTAYKPNQIWASDIAYIKTEEGTLYLAIVLDLFTRKIVGWAMSESLKDDLVKNAFKSACLRYEPEEGLIFHSDRGSQYCSQGFRKLLNFYKCRQSMSDAGNCYDNAISETFFKTLRAELTYHVTFKNRKDAKRDLFDYIECFYNRVRLHSGIGYCSPQEYEEIFLLYAA